MWMCKSLSEKVHKNFRNEVRIFWIEMRHWEWEGMRTKVWILWVSSKKVTKYFEW